MLDITKPHLFLPSFFLFLPLSSSFTYLLLLLSLLIIMLPKSIKKRPQTRKSWKRHVVPDAPDSPEIHHIYNRNAKRHRWILASDPNPAVASSSSIAAPSVTASSASVASPPSAAASVAPPAAVDEDGSDYDDDDYGFDFAPDAGSSLETNGVDDDWNDLLLDKLALAYKISCASKMPEPAMDQAPSFGCGCDQPYATRSVTCYYVTGK
jgi:hypothetical protein